jgi:WD40 repeat protein
VVDTESGANRIEGVAFRPDSGMLAVTDGKSVQLWKLGRAKPEKGPTLVGFAEEVQAVAFSPDGKMLAAGSKDKKVRVWDLTDTEPRELGKPVDAAPSSGPLFLAFTPNGKTLVTAGYRIRLWNLTGQKLSLRSECQVSHVEGCLAFAMGRNRMAAAEQGGGVHLWELGGSQDPPRASTLKLKTSGGLTPYSLAFSPDGKQLCMGAQSGTLIWKLTEKDRQEPWMGRHGVAGHIVGRAVFAPDGKKVASAYRFDAPTLMVWEPEAPEDKDRRVYLPKRPLSFALASDSRHVAVGTEDGPVYILRLTFPPLRPPAR